MTSVLRSGRVLPGLIALGILIVLLAFTAGCTQQTETPATTTQAPAAGLANPASVYCGDVGGTLEIMKDATGAEYGMCKFPNGTSCEEWALFRGEGCNAGVTTATTTAAGTGMANPASVYCGDVGGTLEIMKDATGAEYGMCKFPNGTSCEEWALYRGEGCNAGVTAATTTAAAGKQMVTFTEADNGRTEKIAQDTRFAVVLKENPTTGYAWNATVSSGLEIQSSDYQQDKAAEGMVGVGGSRTWVIVAKDSGDQTFSAVYGRSWEAVTGSETSFALNINVEKIL